MSELRAQDYERFRRGLLRWPAVGHLVVAALLVGLAVYIRVHRGSMWIPLLAACVLAVFAIEGALRWAKAHEFRSPKLKFLWLGCEERLARFEEARRKHRRTAMPELVEMPATIARVAQNLRLALRRADVVLREIEESEGAVGMAPPMIPHYSPAADAHRPDGDTAALYRLADRNVAEYRAGLASLLAGVSRTEAQAMVFSTTLDALRLKMLGYRLGSRRTEMERDDFLATIGEAKMQMNAIDLALEDLELNVLTQPPIAFPEPPPLSEDGLRLRGGE